MANKKEGYVAVLFYGTVGSQAATQLTGATDIDYEVTPEFGDMTSRGSGSTLPIQVQQPTQLSAKLTWKMINNSADTALAALIAAARNTTPTAVALYYKDYSSGKGFDGDCY